MPHACPCGAGIRASVLWRIYEIFRYIERYYSGSAGPSTSLLGASGASRGRVTSRPLHT